jgi:hypothetical protein
MGIDTKRMLLYIPEHQTIYILKLLLSMINYIVFVVVCGNMAVYINRLTELISFNLFFNLVICATFALRVFVPSGPCVHVGVPCSVPPGD